MTPDSDYIVNALNQYTSITQSGVPYTPTYDDNGSLTSDGVWTFTYNVENQLTRAEKTGIDANYEYDPYGRRSKKSGTGVVTEVYLNNGSNEIADYDGSGTVLRRYIHGPGIDEPVAMTTGTGFTTIEYYHADYLGSIVAMSDNTGALSEQYRYSPYGEVDDTSGNPFRYTGRRLDAETGLYYYRARYYSPTLGRFLQVDPIGYGDGLNNQAYVGNDPINAVDPSGTRGIIKRYETIYYLSDDGSGGAGGSSGGAGTPCPECENVIVTGNRIKPIKYSGVSASFRLSALNSIFGQGNSSSRGGGGSIGSQTAELVKAIVDSTNKFAFCGLSVNGIEVGAGVTGIASGLPIIEKPRTSLGGGKASSRTSFASSELSKLAGIKIRNPVTGKFLSIPTINAKGRITKTTNLGRAAGRTALPIGILLTLKGMKDFQDCLSE